AFFTLLHPGLHRSLGSLVSGLLSCEWRPLARTAKAAGARRRLCDQIALEIRDRDHRVIERSRDIHNPDGNVFLLLLAKDFLLAGCGSFSHKLFLARCLFLGNCRATRSFTSARVGVSALTAYRQPAPMS